MPISSKSLWKMKLIIFPPCHLSAHHPLEFLFLRMKLSVWQAAVVLKMQASWLSSFQIIYYIPQREFKKSFYLIFSPVIFLQFNHFLSFPHWPYLPEWTQWCIFPISYMLWEKMISRIDHWLFYLLLHTL